MGDKAKMEDLDSADMIIRRLGPQDAASLHTFYKSVQPVTRRIFGSYQFTLEHAEKLAQASRNDPDKQHYVATHSAMQNSVNGQIIGLCWFWKWTYQVPWFGIMITDAYQGQGIGRTMLARMIEVAKQAGKGGILLTTAKTNVHAQSLYRRFGFEILGDAVNGEFLMMLNFKNPF